jgi:plasmid stability protein
MATLQVRDIDDGVYNELKQRAKTKHRSLSQEVVSIIEDYLSRPLIDSRKQSEMLLDLAGAWKGPESAEVIIKSIRKSRIESNRFRKQHGIFD